MKNAKFVDNLKLRVGWGQTGNAGNMTPKADSAKRGDAPYK